MKKIADISIFNDLADLAESESPQGGDSDLPIGSNFEYNLVRQARNIKTHCDELIRQMNETAARGERYSMKIRGKFMDAIKDLDDQVYTLSQRSSKETPALRAAFYDASKAHDMLIHRYHLIYDGFSSSNYTPYMSREAYVNRPISHNAVIGSEGSVNPTNYPIPSDQTNYPIPFGGLLRDGLVNGGPVQAQPRRDIDFPTIPEVVLASTAAKAVVRAHENFKNWYNNVCEFGRIVDARDKLGMKPSKATLGVWSNLLDEVALPDTEGPQIDMLDVMAGVVD